MHPYSIDTKERVNVIAYIAFISLLISYGVSMLLELMNIKIPFYIELIIDLSPVGLFTLFYSLFDNYFWKCRLFRFIVKTPNLNGTWKGEYTSSYPSPETPKRGKVTMTIEQTWTKIRICSDNGDEESSSCSQVAGIFIDDRNGIVIKYEYENDSKNFIETMSRHTGFSKLKYYPATNTLKGDYYNDRHRKTYGDLNYKLFSEN